MVFKINSFTCLNWKACVICFLKECNVNYSKGALIEWSTKIKIWKNAVIRPCNHFFAFVFHIPSSSWYVWNYSLLKHTQKIRMSDKWCIYPDNDQCLFHGYIFKLKSCIIHMNTQSAMALMATSFESVQSIATAIMIAWKINDHAFWISLKWLVCIAC